MHHCSILSQIYQNFISMIHTQFGATIKVFRSNSGGEYMSREFHCILANQGTFPQLSYSDAHQQNGVAKCKHRHIMKTARFLLVSSSMP